MTVAGALRLLLTTLALAVCAPRSAASQWIPYDSNPRNILEGNWQSCLEPDGRYSERVYDHIVNGVPQYEVHLGPRREFGLFAGIQDEHRPHESPANLLKPFRVTVDPTNRATRRWEIPSLTLAMTVSLGAASSGGCESWYVVVEPLEKTSH